MSEIREDGTVEIAMELDVKVTLLTRVHYQETMDHLQVRAKNALSHITVVGEMEEQEGTLTIEHTFPVPIRFLTVDEIEAFKQQYQEEEK